MPPNTAIPGVEIFEWRPGDGRINFGDHLARIIPGQILAQKGRTAEDEVVRPCRLLTVGSVMHFARDGDTVWGSGVNGKVDPALHRFKRLDVRAVRGPLTAEWLRARGIDCPDVFGDPGLLVGSLFGRRFPLSASQPHVIVPNLHDLPLLTGRANVASPLRGWNQVVAAIAAARLVVASSLHGLIIADSLGIPSRPVRLSDTEALFKYEDYYLGVGKPMPTIARSINEALEMGGAPPATFDPGALLAAFPFDLWADPV